MLQKMIKTTLIAAAFITTNGLIGGNLEEDIEDLNNIFADVLQAGRGMKKFEQRLLAQINRCLDRLKSAQRNVRMVATPEQKAKAKKHEENVLEALLALIYSLENNPKFCHNLNTSYLAAVKKHYSEWKPSSK